MHVLRDCDVVKNLWDNFILMIRSGALSLASIYLWISFNHIIRLILAWSLLFYIMVKMLWLDSKRLTFFQNHHLILSKIHALFCYRIYKSVKMSLINKETKIIDKTTNINRMYFNLHSTLVFNLFIRFFLETI